MFRTITLRSQVIEEKNDDNITKTIKVTSEVSEFSGMHPGYLGNRLRHHPDGQFLFTVDGSCPTMDDYLRPCWWRNRHSLLGIPAAFSPVFFAGSML